MKLHHVGIIHSSHDEAMDKLWDLGLSPLDSRSRYAYLEVWDCECWLYDQVEIVVPHSGSLKRYLDERGNSIHHMAFQVPDIYGHCLMLQRKGIPLASPDPVYGVPGIRVNFVLPSYFGGSLIELVEEV